MQVKIKRLDKSLPLPEYQTNGSVAFDIYSREDTVVEVGETKLLPTNLIVETPPGYMLMLASRSSLAKKKNLVMANSVGIIDQDYCGEDDEIKLMVRNIGTEPVKVERGERLAQGMFVKIDTAVWQEADNMDGNSRGGFGSTG